jgi:hypothetical protein
MLFRCARSCYGPLSFICVLGLGLSKAQQFSGRLYKEASRLGFREFRILDKTLSCVLRVASLRGWRCRHLSYQIYCCEGSCVHQGLSGSGLRRVDSLHVACWIRSSSSGCVHRVIGRLSIRVDSLWKIGTKLQGSPAWSLSCGIRLLGWSLRVLVANWSADCSWSSFQIGRWSRASWFQLRDACFDDSSVFWTNPEPLMTSSKRRFQLWDACFSP